MSSFNNMSRSKFGYCNTYRLLIFNKLILIQKQCFRLFFEVEFGMVQTHLIPMKRYHENVSLVKVCSLDVKLAETF